MESRLKSLISLKRSNKSSPDVSVVARQTRDVRLTAYSNTVAGNPPFFEDSPIRRDRPVKIHATKRGLTFSASSYDAAKPGKPPTFGTTPLKGNGPVKLQTSRRLSSGELLQTNQDSSRTFMEVKTGDYVVGGKAKRQSLPRTQTLQSRPNGRNSPSQDAPENGYSRTRSPENFVRGPVEDTSAMRSSEISPSASSLKGRRRQLSDLDGPNPWLPGLTEHDIASPRRPSLQSREELDSDQNATIKALWKAEYTRLVSLYGKEGVDRNIAEMNKSLGPGNLNLSDESDGPQTARRRGMSVDSDYSESVVPHSLHNSSPAQLFDNQAGSDDSGVGIHAFPPLFRDTGSPTTGSMRSFSSFQSRISSEDNSSIQTGRPSLQSNGASLNTKEDVRKIVDDMRSNYLKAIESSSSRGLPKKQTRSSYSHGPANSSPRAQKSGRRSWHGVTTSSSPSSGAPSPTMTKNRKNKKSSKWAPTPDGGGTMSLARADSTTLGAAFPRPSRRQTGEPVPPTPSIPQIHSTPPSSSRQSESSPPAGQTDMPNKNEVSTADQQQRPIANRGTTISTTTTTSSTTAESSTTSTSNNNDLDLVTPIIDNYDIFYLPETLTRSSSKADAPRPLVPDIDIDALASWSGADGGSGGGVLNFGERDYGEMSDSESAPPPPSISWTPRRRKSGNDLTAM